VVVHFVDISRIDDLHYLICRFITVECDQIYKTFKYTLEKPKGQSRMDNPEIVATLGTQNTGRTNKTKHRTEKQNKTQDGQTKQNTGQTKKTKHRTDKQNKTQDGQTKQNTGRTNKTKHRTEKQNKTQDG
jgi:hypothetical protein